MSSMNGTLSRVIEYRIVLFRKGFALSPRRLMMPHITRSRMVRSRIGRTRLTEGLAPTSMYDAVMRSWVADR